MGQNRSSAPVALLYDVEYHHAVGCRDEDLRLPEKCLVLFSLFIGQPGKILDPESADEEGTFDRTVLLDCSVPLQSLNEKSLLVAHHCDLLLEGVQCLNVAADLFLQVLQRVFNLLDLGVLAGFAYQNFHVDSLLWF